MRSLKVLFRSLSSVTTMIARLILAKAHLAVLAGTAVTLAAPVTAAPPPQGFGIIIHLARINWPTTGLLGMGAERGGR